LKGQAFQEECRNHLRAQLYRECWAVIGSQRMWRQPIGLVVRGGLGRGKCCRHSTWITLPLKMGSIGCPETSVTNYRCTLRDIPEERRSHLPLHSS
jgi:hypothetical protein